MAVGAGIMSSEESRAWRECFNAARDKAERQAAGIFGPGDDVQVGQRVNVSFPTETGTGGYSGEVLAIEEDPKHPERKRFLVMCPDYPPDQPTHWWPAHYCSLPKPPPPFPVGPQKRGDKP
jgi:hypothetical protein